MYSPVCDKYSNGAEPSIAELLRFTICESDGSTSDVLMKLIGGPGSVMAFLEEIQVPDIHVAHGQVRTLLTSNTGKGFSPNGLRTPPDCNG